MDGEVGTCALFEKDCELEILTFDSPEGKHAFWHTGAHIMAQAIQYLFPDAQFGIGPALDDGWYYDIGGTEPFTPDQFEAIEAEMKKIVKADLPVENGSSPWRRAARSSRGRPTSWSCWRNTPKRAGSFRFTGRGILRILCAGPHLMSTGAVKAVKLLSTASAYWRGDAARDSLCRVRYGIPQGRRTGGLSEHAGRGQKRDHRKLGKELGLFALLEEAPGFLFFLPKGMLLKKNPHRLLARNP